MTSTPAPVIVWFRRDLRLDDNPALLEAVSGTRPVIPLYILDEGYEGVSLGSASKWWLGRSLAALQAALVERGAPLVLRRGHPEVELQRLVGETGATAVYLNRLFEPQAWARDAETAHDLTSSGVECRGFNATLLAVPGTILNGSGQPYKVFTPFSKALLAQAGPAPLTVAPKRIEGVTGLASDDLGDWDLLPTRPDWSRGFDWTPGEAGATHALLDFIRDGLGDYSRGRDLPATSGTSRLSPHLHWGEIHPWRVVGGVRAAAASGGVRTGEAEKFVAEMAWREFSAHLLHAFPQLPERAFHPKYDELKWRKDPKGFEAWTRGQTGYPIVDAGMRQLWTTGWMHNRVRMIAASSLVKDLLIDWRDGQAWFWDTLVDADLANNSQNWQWIAGSGADASPFFRVFNPTTQGEKFDTGGDYVRRWVPELSRLPARWIHAPANAPAEVLASAGIRIGRDYPRPIVDHAAARDRALAALKAVGQAMDDQRAASPISEQACRPRSPRSR